jgi:hypothetical protein
MTEEKDKHAEPAKDKPPEPRLTHEQFMQRLKNDPHFIVHDPRAPQGEGFIIGGQPPQRPKPE